MSNHDRGSERPPNEDPMLGAVVDDRYFIEELIGTGGMGRVYRAHQRSAGRDVALKVLADRISRDQESVNRFSQEAQIISRLRHPNTIRLFDVGQLPDGRLYVVTELLSGVSLRDVLKRGPLHAERAMRVGYQVCDALGEAHAMGIIHRDLKPANLMLETLGDQEYVKVLDFGVAKLAGDGDATMSGLILGTPTYMSPEQALGHPVDARSDIYSLGVILYCCLAGRPPFSPTTPQAAVYHHIHAPPPRFSELSSPVEVPAALEDLLWEMLAKDRNLRPADTREVQRRLQVIMARPAGDRITTGSGTGYHVVDSTAAYPDRTEASMAPVRPPSAQRQGPQIAAVLLLILLMGVAFGTLGRDWLWPSAPVEPPMAAPPPPPARPRPLEAPSPDQPEDTTGDVADGVPSHAVGPADPANASPEVEEEPPLPPARGDRRPQREAREAGRADAAGPPPGDPRRAAERRRRAERRDRSSARKRSGDTSAASKTSPSDGAEEDVPLGGFVKVIGDD